MKTLLTSFIINAGVAVAVVLAFVMHAVVTGCELDDASMLPSEIAAEGKLGRAEGGIVVGIEHSWAIAVVARRN